MLTHSTKSDITEILNMPFDQLLKLVIHDQSRKFEERFEALKLFIKHTKK